MKYAVIVTYSFDWHTPVWLFKTMEEAKSFLKQSAQNEFRIDTEEDGWKASIEFDNDEEYAKISVYLNDDTYITEFRIGEIN